jgi:dihydrofolate reductase
MDISIIVACANNGVIGRENALPWYLPEDLKHFKGLTMGKPMIMGRKTFESIGRPLPGRTSLVVTRQHNWRSGGVIRCASVEEALQTAKTLLTGNQQEVMVIGGADIYRQVLPLATRIYQTVVDADVAGDAHFPALDLSQWQCEESVSGVSEKTGLAYRFVTLVRK